MTSNTQQNTPDEHQPLASLAQIMASYGITDNNIYIKQLKNKDRLAYEKWQLLVKEILTGNK